MTVTCRTCPFWCPDDPTVPTVGDCRIRAPRHFDVKPVKGVGGGDSRVFPATVDTDWCGEHPRFSVEAA